MHENKLLADEKALDAILAVRPVWRSSKKLADVVDLPANVLLHAGPPFSSPREITQPILNSACIASVFEGLADNFAQAEAKIRHGEIQLKAAQDFNLVTPLAAVVSASMWVHEVIDSHAPTHCTYTPINGGNGAAMRLGLCNQAVLHHIQWLNGEFAEALVDAHRTPIDLIDIAATALTEDDDCHGRTPVGTRETINALQPGMGEHQQALAFLQDSPSFFLNLWMAACKCQLSAATGIPGSSVITAAGGNGLRVGIQLAGLTGQWFEDTATPPRGDTPGYPAERALGAIGDSAIVDICGFGAMAMHYSTTQQSLLGAFMPDKGMQRPGELFARTHPGFGTLNFLTGLTAHRVVDQASTPLVSLGILDCQGQAGRIGGGIFDMPMGPFAQAVTALDGMHRL